jgi:3-hydroxy-3-methylglutaryl CoA synthase/uncharacterized OB-fold protein
MVGYGSYVPYWRLERSAIGAALGSGAGKGSRSVASFDEDSTSMGVEAARSALAAAPEGFAPDSVLFVTTSPAYLDKTNATALHAALGLREATGAYDFGGAPRSATGALRLAQRSVSSLVVCADVRTGLPSSGDEAQGGDAAVAFAFGSDGPALVDILAETSSSEEFLDRWRTPGDVASKVWEERFGETAYSPLARSALTEAFKQAGITAETVDHLIVTGLNSRAVRSLIAWSGVPKEHVVDDLTARIGNSGTAHPGLVLADVLDRASAGESIVLVHLADGADVTVYRTTPALEVYRQRSASTVATQIESGRSGLSYESFLTWRGFLDREPPRRPDPISPAAPVSMRHEHWKFGFTGSSCEVCGTRHLPPARVCLKCHAVDQMAAERFADLQGTVTTFTIDRLAFSLAAPLVAAVVDFDGGGRFTCEVTDLLPEEMEIGRRVALTFRRLYTSTAGVHNYFWKARLIREGA